MKSQSPFLPVSRTLLVALAGAFLAVSATTAHAQRKKSNPASKVYVSDVSGETMIDTGENIEEVAKRSVYSVEGTVIETKRPESKADRSRTYSTMVYSNGTGAFFDSDTRVEIKKFLQEPFSPNRADIENEPSISQTHAFVSRGAVGLCNSKLVAGSTMSYQTPLGSVNIRGRKVVIETDSSVTKISMLEGESTVRAGPMDMGGHLVRAGEQAVIRPGAPGQPNQIQVIKIPSSEIGALDDRVAMACMAKKSVYFEVKEKKDDGSSAPAAAESPGTTPTTDTAVTAFDSAQTTPPTVREIVAVEVTPVTAPVELTLSVSRVENPPAPGR